MRVLITTRIFPPEGHPSAVMADELAEALAGEGWGVTVATGYPNHPYGRLFPSYVRRGVQVERHNGFQVVRGWHLIHPSPALLPRALVMASQCTAFLAGALKSRRPNVVVSYGPPLIGPLSSALIAKSLGARLVTVIYDLYPDVAIEGGHLCHTGLIHLARKIEKLVYQLSDKIVVISEGFRQTLLNGKGVEPHKVSVIPVWLDSRDIIPLNRDNSWRRQMNIPPDKFVVLYAGSIGLVSGAEVVVEAARLLESYPDILFVFVGEGQMKDRLEAQARNLGLTNMRFLSFQPRERLSEVQATADVSLVSLAPGRGRTSVPSKVLGYMAAARPVVASVDDGCDTAMVIQQAECGHIVTPGRGQDMAKAILAFYQSPTRRKACGKAGRRYFLHHFEKKIVLQKFIDLIKEC